MRIIIVYKSKTGFTKRYAEWIQDEIKCDILDYDNISQSSLTTYDVIVYGSRIHAGRIDGLKKIQALVADNRNTQLVVFATGGTPKAAEDVIKSFWQASFSDEELIKIPHFYIQAGLNYEKMGLGDKLIMKTLARVLSNRKDKNSVESGCEQAIGQSYDISSRECITPLIEYIKTMISIE